MQMLFWFFWNLLSSRFHRKAQKQYFSSSLYVHKGAPFILKSFDDIKPLTHIFLSVLITAFSLDIKRDVKKSEDTLVCAYMINYLCSSWLEAQKIQINVLKHLVHTVQWVKVYFFSPRKISWISWSQPLNIFFSPCRRRQANLLKGKQLLREGKVSEARECFTRSINITHVMAHKVIKVSPIGNEAKENKWPTSSKLVMSCILMGEQENEGREITLGLTSRKWQVSGRGSRILWQRRVQQSPGGEILRTKRHSPFLDKWLRWAPWAPCSVETEVLIPGASVSPHCPVVFNMYNLHFCRPSGL